VRRFGEVGVMRLGAASLALGLALVPLPGLFAGPNPLRLTIFAVIALFVPVGTAFLFPSSTALVSRRAPQGEVGQVMGVQQAFGGVSRLVGPIWAGAAFEIGFGFPFSFDFALIELLGRTLAYLFEAASAPSPQHGCVDQGDSEHSNHEHVDHEPKPPAGIAVHRCAPAYRATSTRQKVFRSTLCRTGADSNKPLPLLSFSS
jgi:hypothetical protein